MRSLNVVQYAKPFVDHLPSGVDVTSAVSQATNDFPLFILLINDAQNVAPHPVDANYSYLLVDCTERGN